MLNIKNTIKKAYLFWSILLLISLGINAWFIWGKGIQIFNDNRIYNHAYQNQQQAQLIISLFASQGTLSWDVYTLKDLENKGFTQGSFAECIAAFLNSLAPEQSLMTKIIHQHMTDCLIFVPKIIEENN